MVHHFHHLKVLFSGILSLGILSATSFYPLIPCRKMPNIPDPEIISFTRCVLVPNTSESLESLTYYLWFFKSPIITSMVLFILFFLVFMFFFSLSDIFKRHRHH